jgi:hypothetical protein
VDSWKQKQATIPIVDEFAVDCAFHQDSAICVTAGDQAVLLRRKTHCQDPDFVDFVACMCTRLLRNEIAQAAHTRERSETCWDN